MNERINNNFFVLFFFRAIFKYDEKTIVHTASGTDYEKFRSSFGG